MGISSDLTARQLAGLSEVDAAPPLASDDLLTSAAVRKLVGGISDMSLWRWSRSRDLQFPKPDFVLARRKFWRRSTVEAWLARQAGQGRAA